MNSESDAAMNDLKKTLAMQRAQRNAAGGQPPSRLRPRRNGTVAVVVTIGIFIGWSLGAGYLPGDLLSLATETPGTGTPGTETPDTETPGTETHDIPTPSPAPWLMTVCESVTWLHVRFGPGRNAEVRGYLRGGETVTLAERDGNWALLSAPVAGWADTRYLCGGQP